MRISLEDQRRREKRERAPPMVAVLFVWFLLGGVAVRLSECRSGWFEVVWKSRRLVCFGVGSRLVDFWVKLESRLLMMIGVGQTLVFRFPEQFQKYQVTKTTCLCDQTRR